MATKTQVKLINNIFELETELKSFYNRYNLNSYEEIYNTLLVDDMFLKAVILNLILIGENSRKLQDTFKRFKEANNMYALSSLIDKQSNNLRLIRNKIAHDYYNIELVDIYKELVKLHNEYMNNFVNFISSKGVKKK